jgi:hypothetical protein
MSDVSVLSHEYQSTSELSQAINTNLIVLKKVVLGLPGAENVAAAQVRVCRSRLADILEILVKLLDAQRAMRVTVSQALTVPGAVVERLKKERNGYLASYLHDLENLVARLRTAAPQLTSADFATLDHLAAIADAETSGVFRQMMRR